MSNNVIRKESAFLDELIRENARLIVQHEADMQRLAACVERLEQYEKKDMEDKEAITTAQDCVRMAEARLSVAIADLHKIMAGGNPCEVCTAKCLMGEGNCKPVWRGEGDVQ